MTVIREATVADAAGIARVLKQISELRLLADVSLEAVADRVRDSLTAAAASATSTILVATGKDDQVVGYCAVHWVPFLFLAGGEAYVSELFVEPGERSLGSGSALLADAEQRARSRGCARISLLNGRDSEAFRREFYAKRGWTLRDRMANFIKPLSGE